MAATWHLHMCMLFITMLSVVDAWFLPLVIRASVPETLPAGYVVAQGKVNYFDTLKFTTSDENFSFGREGITVLSDTVVPPTGRTFSVSARDASGRRSEMNVYLERIAGPQSGGGTRTQGFLKRAKREWKPPPFNILENGLQPFPKNLDHIGSNSAENYTVYYIATGPGVTQEPVGLLSVSREGLMKVHGPIDRETYPIIKFTVNVFDIHTHQKTDVPLTVTVIVDDVNDNKPEFNGLLSFNVLERSKIGTKVGQVNATDKDQEGLLHTKINYKIIDGTNLFAINPNNGLISVKDSQLDRETKDIHLVTVQIKDMDGTDKGLANTATATITLGDINDNAPSFTKPSYNTNVDENVAEKLILRIPVVDKDLINTANWKAVFKITEGNDDGNFRVETDPKTNEGLLYVVKPLDYEKTKSVNLKLQAQNEAALVGPSSAWMSVPVVVGVNNVDEGPQFTAPNVRFTVKENVPNGTVIGSYTAADPETSGTSGIRYYKVSDPASWVSVDSNSGELRVANVIDRESPVVQNGVYNITMKAVDASQKSALGKVTLVVEDENDHDPQLPTKELILCEKEGRLGSVVVNAIDGDQSPYAGPFNFGTTNADWNLQGFNETAASLVQAKYLPLGLYKVPMLVTDLQGKGTFQTVQVKICQCRNGVCVSKGTSVGLGPMGILALLLPLLLLLLLGILLALFCATAQRKLELEDVGDGGGILLKSNIEVPGEEVVDPMLFTCPGFVTDQISGSVKGSLTNVGWVGNKSSSTIGGNSLDNRQSLKQGFALNSFSQNSFGQNSFAQGQHRASLYGKGQYGQFDESQYVGTMSTQNGHLFHEDAALNHRWQTTGQCINQKLVLWSSEENEDYANDVLRPYEFEGEGSAAGSVGCCSEMDRTEDMAFLNALGPKFKTLADACTKK